MTAPSQVEALALSERLRDVARELGFDAFGHAHLVLEAADMLTALSKLAQTTDEPDDPDLP